MRAEVLGAVPGAGIASDQPYRAADLAIDFCEDVPPLPAAEVRRIVAIFERHGAHAKVSSIHVNGWFGDYDKLTTSRLMMAELFGVDLDAARARYVFAGNSPNDAPMFGFFPNARGRRQRARLRRRHGAPAALDHDGALRRGVRRAGRRPDRGPPMSLPRPPAAVVFDMDGLLFDTERLYGEAILTAAAEVGCAMSRDVFLQLVGRSQDLNHRFLLDHYGADYPLTALVAAWGRHFRVLANDGVPMKAGAAELLDLLDERGLPRAIATSSSHPTVQRNLAALGLADRFHRVVAHGDYRRGKPSPDPFLKAAELLGVPPELCLALEDSHNGVRSAAAAGMMTVMVPDLIPATDEIAGLCCRVVADLHAVGRLLQAT